MKVIERIKVAISRGLIVRPSEIEALVEYYEASEALRTANFIGGQQPMRERLQVARTRLEAQDG